jgi:methylmalonyl-CoA carboxyltransferase small subunit
VAVIEAMKMKTVIAAHRGGKIAAIHVQPGDAVQGGQPLLRIE